MWYFVTRYKFCIDVGTQTHGWHFPDKINSGAASEKQLSPSQTAGAGAAFATSSPSSSTASPEEQRVVKSAPSARWVGITRNYY